MTAIECHINDLVKTDAALRPRSFRPHLERQKHRIQSPLLIPILAKTRVENAAANGLVWEWSAPPEKIMEYFTQIVAWSRVCCLEEPGFDGAEYH